MSRGTRALLMFSLSMVLVVQAIGNYYQNRINHMLIDAIYRQNRLDEQIADVLSEQAKASGLITSTIVTLTQGMQYQNESIKRLTERSEPAVQCDGRGDCVVDRTLFLGRGE